MHVAHEEVRRGGQPGSARSQPGGLWGWFALLPVFLWATNGQAQQPGSGVGRAADRGAPVAGAAITVPRTADCLKCHALPNLGYREGGQARVFTVAPQAFRGSAHGTLACVQCHSDVAAYPHVPSAQRKRVTCDADCHAVDASGRPYTHRGVVARFRESVYGRPVRDPTGLVAPDPDAPTCLTCHGDTGSGNPHAIAAAKSLTRAAKVQLCVSCHDDRALMEKHRVPAEAVASYRRSFHYKSLLFGGTGTAICIDCHTAHDILPASDPRSSVAAASLTKTCGRARCHEGARRNFAVSGANHLDLRVESEPVLWFEEKFFLLLTGGTMLMLLVGIALDVQRKFGWAALAARAGRAIGRTVERFRPSLVRSSRRGLELARRILID